MIRINLSDNKKREIEKDFWKWIVDNCYDDLEQVLKKDKLFVSTFLDGRIDKRTIKKFLLSSPETLENIAVTKKCSNDDTAEKLRELYKKYRTNKAVDIFEAIGINACPYCNQNVLSVLRRKDGTRIFCGELDHFYNKKEYPDVPTPKS